MLFSILSGGNIQTILISLLLTLPVILFALSLHETAHGFVAWKCGDNTAYNLGRLSLNPLRHLDPMGFLCMLLFGFGWARPVPINTRNFKNPKWGTVLTAAAGPLANLILGTFNAVLYGFCKAWYSYLFYSVGEGFLLTCVNCLSLLLYYGSYLNFLLMAFNLIPIPPFDGSRIALAFLPPQTYFRMMRYERQIMFGILIVLLFLSRFGFSPFSWIADKLTDLISGPVCNGFWKLFLNMLPQ